MLNNTYNYSKYNLYQQAFFLLGAGYRAKMMQKVKEYHDMRDLKLDWTFYGEYVALVS